MNEPAESKTYRLQLAGVSCNGCVSKIRQALQLQDPDTEIDVQLEQLQARVDSSLPMATIMDIIQQLGYQAEPAAHGDIQFQVQGVKCQGCVNKIRQALQQQESSAEVEAQLDQGILSFDSALSSEQIHGLLQQLDYAAQCIAEAGPVKESTDAQPKPSIQSRERHSADDLSVPDSQSADVVDKGVESSLASIQLSLTGMTCAGCVKSVEDALNSVTGVDTAQVNFASRNAQVFYQLDPSATPSLFLDALIGAVSRAGYGATGVENVEQAEQLREANERKEYRRKLWHTLIGLGLGIPLMLFGLLHDMSVATGVERLGWGLVGLVTLLVLLTAGRHFYTGAWKAFVAHNANMDTLIALGTGSAWLYSMVVVLWPQGLPMEARGLYFEAAAMIIGLINLGQALEIKARGRTSQAIKRLLDLRVKTARVLRDGEEVDLPVEQVKSGDQIRVRPGEQLAVDGQVLEGNSLVDEAMLTGEPLPVTKEPGSEVSAGTINRSGSLLYQATRVGRDTVLAQIIDMVRQAQNTKPPISQLADKVASVFVPSVMIIAVLTALIWYNVGPQPQITYMLVTACTVLIIACPCALGLATPISVMIGVGKAAEYGILIRNGDALQRASQLDTVVLDKTGTITEGRPSVTGFVNVSEQDDQSLLALAHSLESRSEHPLADAVCGYAKEFLAETSWSQGQMPALRGFQAITGLGVEARAAEQQLLLGNERLMQQRGIVLELVADTVDTWQQQAKTVIYLAIDGHLSAVLAVSDAVKPEAAAAIRRLHKDGLKVIMLTGDHAATAAAVARATGIDEFQAELMPADKLAYIQTLQDQGRCVAMAGDGINDAPALSQADVGFAIGTGTDVAIESADVTLMRGSLHGIADAIELSRACLKNIRQNLWGAFLYNGLGIPVAAGILYPVAGVLLNPVIAGVAMSLSSLTVVSNANRLRLFKVEKQGEP
ncbi:MAG: heavy metal translocating P-type ATPase [Motiliproteus sp.]